MWETPKNKILAGCNVPRMVPCPGGQPEAFWGICEKCSLPPRTLPWDSASWSRSRLILVFVQVPKVGPNSYPPKFKLRQVPVPWPVPLARGIPKKHFFLKSTLCHFEIKIRWPIQLYLAKFRYRYKSKFNISLGIRGYTAVNIMIYHIMVNSKCHLRWKKIDKLAELNLGFRKLNLLRT